MGKKIKGFGGRSFKNSSSKKPNVNQLLAEAQKTQQLMEDEMSTLEGELANKEVEATSGGGVVKVIANGNLRVKDIIISEELEGEDMEIIKDMIIAATNEAIEKANQIKEEENEKISQKYLGGLQNMGFGL
ncbi:YbaB/EbfC family nucleoid-associated protein [Oceanotoga sp. DSM 15011]|jgi:hypothetical protein|uniref:Nucleoid-associated protein C7380_12725 n=1 Tax=Oceanotoga teriensis TaxID=515440 RepID=A0AA45C4S0_9BACT|nr:MULTISPECIES: YbaB/EbfC family nucleoid-associated protein [Oceanotoga]MDN5341869.1 nucleoid-associated protein EbfC [Oceanotoga sp.]MDO7976650.1 YbaB/EbfC family nucleoid-associated protein [Oceanotoga teriensis]PWJ87020.1 hypothetical protein C7380_12725 [Oceanotoga teriensis]UYP00703.1 YbaB/EbfC family nucleoid-associated protein [Oceanotoga sp. DSM 15011]